MPTDLFDSRTNAWWGGRRTFLLLLGIVAAAATIRLYLFGGYVGTDDDEYARFAYQLAHGAMQRDGYEGPAVFPLRIGVIAPVALLIRFFGIGEWTLALYPFVLSLVGVMLAFACAARLFGPRAGLLASALVAVFPWDIDGATRLWPDLPAAFFAAAAGTALVFVSRSEVRSQARMFAGGAIVGLLLGLSWLAKESVAYLAPFCLIWMAVTIRQDGRRFGAMWGGVAAASLAILVAEMLAYQSITGDLLFRFHETDRNYAQWQNGFFSEGSDFGWQAGESYAKALIDRLFVSGPSVILFNRTFLYLPLFGLLVGVYAVWRRERAFLFPVLWLAGLVLTFNFASSSPSSYLPLPLFHRYLSPIYFPAIVVVAGFLSTTLFSDDRSKGGPGRASRISGLVTAGIIGYVGSTELWLKVGNRSTWLEEVAAVSAQVQPQTVLYADAVSLRALEFYHHYPPATAWRDLEAAGSPGDIAPGSLVLVYPPGIQWLHKNAGMWVRWPAPGPTDPRGYLVDHFYRTPPPTWSPVWRRGDVILYRVGS